MKNRENQFDRLYEIRLAGLHEIPRIMQFIKENWSENHILGRDKACFLYEYCDRSQVHMVVAYRRKTGVSWLRMCFLRGKGPGSLGEYVESAGRQSDDAWSRAYPAPASTCVSSCIPFTRDQPKHHWRHDEGT